MKKKKENKIFSKKVEEIFYRQLNFFFKTEFKKNIWEKIGEDRILILI